MDQPRELYHEEIQKLKAFRSKLFSRSVYKEELIDFADDYEELISQTKVITRVSDRLQKKLDKANIQIKTQNDEIRRKNLKLEEAIHELTKARIGRKASTIMLTVALFLFLLEQYFLQPLIETSIPANYRLFGLFMLLGLFLIVKFLESGLEKYFLKQEQKKIIQNKAKGKVTDPYYVDK